MSTVPENGKEPEAETFGLVTDEVTQPEADPARSRPSWKQVAMAAGGIVVTAVGAAVVTLAVTHNTARMANAAAYAHGLLDGAEAERNRHDYDEDDYYIDEDDY